MPRKTPEAIGTANTRKISMSIHSKSFTEVGAACGSGSSSPVMRARIWSTPAWMPPA
ncbi:hypothetical protein Y695_04889 [Hydrogenophaga sp. T4]|nr:hypothetical protein Y695_04889 [Hydrogenophaga sp. T4]